jgi:tyrosine-protein kinase Etk/Wzc
LFAGFDEVIVDSPPVLAKSDTVVLATLVDEVVLVLRAGRSTQEEARAARQYLAAVGGNVVGVILNAVNPKHVRYGYSYNYSYAGSA